MSIKLLGQILLKSRAGIEKGVLRIQDIVERYRNAGGGELSTEDQAFLLKQFNEMAPEAGSPFSNVEEVFFGPGDLRLGGKKKGPNVQKAGEMSDTPVTDKIMKDRDVELRGDESFGEILEKFKTKEEGIGSLFPKGKPGEIFDVDNSRREEVATFIKDMRKAKIKNKDIKDLFKLTATNIEQGKRAATSLARAADMGADTQGKQELLSEFDEMKMDKGPRFFQEEYMGYDSFSDAIRAKASEINNAIVDDLDRLGVDDETVTRIVSSAREVMNRNPFAGPDEMLASIKQDLEFENIKYDVTFFENLLNEYRKLMRKPEPRFEYGGMA